MVDTRYLKQLQLAFGSMDGSGVITDYNFTSVDEYSDAYDCYQFTKCAVMIYISNIQGDPGTATIAIQNSPGGDNWFSLVLDTPITGTGAWGYYDCPAGRIRLYVNSTTADENNYITANVWLCLLHV